MRPVLLLTLLAAWGCASAVSETATPPVSLWGEIITVAQGEQSAAPAMLSGLDGVMAAWIGSDEAGVHQDVRWVIGDQPAETVVLPLPPIHPYAQRLAPAASGGAHLLWLDAFAEGDGGLRLFTAHINPALQVERGPIRASDRQTLRYAMTANGDGSLWVVWSGGLLAQPGLYAQYIDAQSRPRIAQHLIDNADWPALTRADDGTVYLFWLAGTQVFRAILGDGVLIDAAPVTDSIRLAVGDRLLGFSAGLDRNQGYVFWNVTRAAGAAESWMAHGPLEADTWSQPERLGITAIPLMPFITGYNSGTAQAAQAGDTGLRWTAPAAGQYEALAVAAQVADSLAVVYFRAGMVAGYQPVVTLARDLICPPLLLTDRSRHLDLAWSVPVDDGYAALNFTTTR